MVQFSGEFLEGATAIHVGLQRQGLGRRKASVAKTEYFADGSGWFEFDRKHRLIGAMMLLNESDRARPVSARGSRDQVFRLSAAEERALRIELRAIRSAIRTVELSLKPKKSGIRN